MASVAAPLAIRFTDVWGIESPLTNSDAYGYDRTPLSGAELALNSDVKNIPKQWPTVFSGPVTSTFGVSASAKAPVHDGSLVSYCVTHTRTNVICVCVNVQRSYW